MYGKMRVLLGSHNDWVSSMSSWVMLPKVLELSHENLQKTTKLSAVLDDTPPLPQKYLKVERATLGTQLRHILKGAGEAYPWRLVSTGPSQECGISKGDSRGRPSAQETKGG